MSSYTKRFLFFLFLFSMQFGCAPTLSIKDLVEERGYTYYQDYSTMNILGFEVRDNQLQRNPYFSLTGEKGNIPDITQGYSRVFEIKGSTEIEHFLKRVTEGHITGKFGMSAGAEVTLENPFKEEAFAFIPCGPCHNREMLVVNKVLNTGSMKIIIKDKKGVDITSMFKLKQAGQTEAGIYIEFDDGIIISGKGFYVGYSAELKRCVGVKEKEIILTKRLEHYDSEIGMLAYLSGTREEGDMREALVYISPSNFLGTEVAALGIQRMLGKERRWAEIMTTPGLQIAAAGDPWDDAISPSEEIDTRLWRFTDTQGYKLKFGNRLGIPGIPQVSGLYIEVLSVKEQEVKLRVQSISYEDIKK